MGKPGLSEYSTAGISEAVDNHAIEQMEHALRYVPYEMCSWRHRFALFYSSAIELTPWSQ